MNDEFQNGIYNQNKIKTKGVCNADTRQGIFRKKSNTSRSRLSINQNRQTTSCPSSPRQGLRLNNSTSSLSQLDTNALNIAASSLHRSASTMSAIRPRSSPSGLFSYTGTILLNESNTNFVQKFDMIFYFGIFKFSFIRLIRFCSAIRPWIAR